MEELPFKHKVMHECKPHSLPLRKNIFLEEGEVLHPSLTYKHKHKHKHSLALQHFSLSQTLSRILS